MPKIVVKTKAKTVRGKLEAIIRAHLVCNEKGFVLNSSNPDDSILTFHHGKAVDMILEQFNVTEKGAKS